MRSAWRSPRRGARAVLVRLGDGPCVARALPARLGSALSFAIAIVVFACLIIGARLPEGSPGFPAVADGSWGLRLLLGAARRATDHDGDGFSARFGGGDCDDRRGDVYPGRGGHPRRWRRRELRRRRRQGLAGRARRRCFRRGHRAPAAPRADRFKGNLLISPSMRCGAIVGRRRLRPARPASRSRRRWTRWRARARTSGGPGRRRPTRRGRSRRS